MTPVTWAPRCLASCTAALPTAPEAPLTSTRLPGPVHTRLRNARAVMPPKTTLTASAKSRFAGFAAMPPFWEISAYSA